MASQDGALRLQYHFDLPFLNPTLLAGALLAPGVSTREGNKSFGLLGGTALQLYLQVEGLKRKMNVEQISQAMSQVAGKRNLAQRGFDLGIDKWIRNNPSQGSYISDKLMATTMEAIVGAYFEDQGRTFAALEKIVSVLGLGWPETE
ncbi:ribonuclease III domain-containing protein [Aspergillus foveolatus]|uniref:ribonuclease III domain-containing protein n=1 Tax=Aspergillus foveolatus TaxID=210207 RepID=UPI003CCCBB45